MSSVSLTRVNQHLGSILNFLYLIFIGSPTDDLLSFFILWLIRVITYSLLLRTYFIPWLLVLMSNRLRVRSISLRSIRGIRFRKGAQTWMVERVSYSWSVEGSRRLAVKIEGLTLDFGQEDSKPATFKGQKRHKRNLTLADLGPSPIARRLWGVVRTVTTFLEPYFRPFLRTYLMACLRLVIKWLPKLTQALSFDLHSCVVTFAEIPGGKISAENISLHIALALTQVAQIVVRNAELATSNKEAGMIQSFGFWKKRLADGFQRSLDTALGETHGTAKVSLKVSNLDGSMPRTPRDGSSVSFLCSPGTTDLGVTVNFSPKESQIDKHGLSVCLKVDDCFTKVDLLNMVLDKILLRKAPIPALSHPLVSPAISNIAEGPRFSGFPLASPASAIVSPVYSFTSSLFSPSDANSAKPSILSPTSMLLSPRSPVSASSPFFKALSASIRPRRRHLIQPSAKLKDYKDASKLSILREIDITIASISLSFSITSNPEIRAYRALVKGISITGSLSDRSKNSLHKEHIGSREGSDSFEADAYMLNIALRQITLERDALLQTMRLARLDQIVCQTLIYQWPTPFLNPSPFMRNDGNASLLALKFKLANVHLTDRIDELKSLFTFLESKQHKDKGCHPGSSTISMPRLVVAVEIGPIVARIIYDADHGEMHRAIELRNNGIGFVLKAEYHHPTTAITRLFPAASSVQSMHWTSCLRLDIEPILVRVRSRHDFIGVGDLRVSDIDFLDDPPILSIGTIEAVLTGNAIAQIDGTAEAVAVIDKTSLAADLSVTLETICVELWHPIAVDASLRLISLFPSRTVPTRNSEDTKGPRFANLPVGLSSRFAVGRLVCVITAPDINPDDKVDLSVGFSFRTTLAFEYCSLRANQTHWFDQPQRTQNRIRLRLATEVIPEAIVASKVPSPHDNVALVKVRVTNLIFKEAVATQFEPDEPAIVGREEPAASQPSRDIVLINSIQLDVSLSSRSSVSPSQHADLIDIAVQIPSIRVDLHLASVYSVLLALQTVKLLYPTSPPTPTPSSRSSSLSLTFHADVPVIQGLVSLPTEKLFLHLSGIRVVTSTDTTPRLKWTQAALFVPLPSPKNRWETTHMEGEWDELLRLQSWEISFTTVAGSLCIAIDGDSARIRIPYGLVLADLIQDVSVAAKAVRHLSYMANDGCYSEIPLPEAEGPKSVPYITVRLACLCVDAEDDPFESKLGVIWQIGEGAVKQRMEREDAFSAKVSAILASESEPAQGPRMESEHEYAFDARHTVSIQEARGRLDDVHVLDWSLRLRSQRDQQSKSENLILQELRTTAVPHQSDSLPKFIHLPSQSLVPPLLRIKIQNLCLIVSPPSFSIDQLPDVLQNLGKLPRDTEFSLLVPLHIHFTLSSLHATLRDYPLPLIYISPQAKPSAVSLTFDTDLVIGEEMGTKKSVEWVQCPIIVDRNALHGERLLSISVPKTIMPVKTYAAPDVHISCPEPTILSWAVSYMPAIQDVMRIVDTLTSPPRDSSPAVGFWDKLRLVLHWTANVTFLGEVCLYMKGTRDAHKLGDMGAGFVLCWQGDPKILVGHDNYQKELIQVVSNEMLIAVPNLDGVDARNGKPSEATFTRGSKSLKKVFARLASGVRFGLGFLFERSCGSECPFCTGSTFHRKCRFFSFRPHYEVKLELKEFTPEVKMTDDSFNEFRSDFVHLSVSLTNSTNSKGPKSGSRPSNLYLTPQLFAHFWDWCSLFDGALSLPIRQGSFFPSRHISPKFSRHLATLKYRISLHDLYIMHGYIDDSRETWVDGVVPWVGVKGKIDEFQADMHQREEESTVPGPIPDTTRTTRRKPFYAAEVTLKGLQLRALLAVFVEPSKRTAEITAPPQRSNYRQHTNLPVISPQSLWHDMDDFVELDWIPEDTPTVHLLPVVSCPHFTYFKQNSALSAINPQTSKFGSEHSHSCMLGREPSVTQIQISLASRRLARLKKMVGSEYLSNQNINPGDSTLRMLTLLEAYIAHLRDIDIKPDTSFDYHMPTDNVSPHEWAEFENVYQMHLPSIFLDSAVRDIMMQYYYCSRDRRGLEYHMATRAVKFLRDQANAAHTVDKSQGHGNDRGHGNTAVMAASAIRKMLKGENNTKIPKDFNFANDQPGPTTFDPMDGWAEGVSLMKGHYCLLIKPQIVLRGESSTQACIVAAAQAKIQSFDIMDLANFDDPISGKVMSRNYASVSGFQTFAPTKIMQTSSDGSVPLEVLIDLRCESKAFERLVPQTEAIFHYDKFNQLRLHNHLTTIKTKASAQRSTDSIDSHLQDEMDLIRVHLPRFTVSANADHFQAISTVVNKLLLFSDAVYKTRSDQVQTMLFTYDFTDIHSTLNVVTNLQSRLRDTLETERITLRNLRNVQDEHACVSLQQLRAHIFLLSEELNLLFDAIKLTQDRFHDQTDRKSALLLHASSREISWRMLDEGSKLLSKLVVANINFRWLSRQDSSTVSHLTIGNMSAFDGSRNAIWSEILTKYNEPANHPLLKRGLFLTADWTILPPVGGISVYEAFELNLHPLRLQIDAKVGQRIKEYVWPSQKDQQSVTGRSPNKEVFPTAPIEIHIKSPMSGRSSIDSPRALHSPSPFEFPGMSALSPPGRKLGNSRSFTDLRATKDNFTEHTSLFPGSPITKRSNSSDLVNFSSPFDPTAASGPLTLNLHSFDRDPVRNGKSAGDAQLMKSRSVQKTFVLVRVASIHILLSMVKEGSFECHDARIKTRELEYHNQTWSFEELAGQFMPSNMNWRGWVKMAFNQPLLPVLPVARELISKTKWKSSKSSHASYHESPLQLLHPRFLAVDGHQSNVSLVEETKSSLLPWQGPRDKDPPTISSLPLTAEPESIEGDNIHNGRPTARRRVKSLFSRKAGSRSKSKGPTKRKSGDTNPNQNPDLF